MAIYDKIKDEKLQYGINRKAAKISALSSGKIVKHEYLTGEEILPYDQNRVKEQAKFTYSPIRKAFKKQITTGNQERKQVEVLEVLKPEKNQLGLKSCDGVFPKVMSTNETKNEIHEIKKSE